jgi:UDP-3-O-acyl-N-acetylglucosamine deacetylase
MKVVTFEGQCLNGGHASITVTPHDCFKLFMHADSLPQEEIYLMPRNVCVENHCVSLVAKSRVRVVEHLFSALYGLGLFNVKIDVFGDEIPFFDGSCQHIVQVLNNLVCAQPSKTMCVPHSIEVHEDNAYICYTPADSEVLTIHMGLLHPYIEPQHLSISITRDSYINKIAPARTFVFTTDNDPRLKNIPPYGIGITDTKVYAAEPLRFADELVRHKILDVLGDLFILKKRLCGTLRCRNTSHRLNIRFVREILDKMDNHT